MRQLESGEISVWSLFEDYVLLGDSRAVGFSFYGFLPEERVLAESGATILHLEEHIPDIVALNPSNIFLCYGLNDIMLGTWPTPSDYVTKFTSVINEIHEQLPDANIYISSILPAPGSSVQSQLADYSQALDEMCGTLPRCYFVDNSEISSEYAGLWENDSIHVVKDFYPHWANNLITAVYSSSLEDADDSTDTSSADPSADTDPAS